MVPTGQELESIRAGVRARLSADVIAFPVGSPLSISSKKPGSISTSPSAGDHIEAECMEFKEFAHWNGSVDAVVKELSDKFLAKIKGVKK